MRFFIVFLAVAFGTGLSADENSDKSTKFLKEIQGKWTIAEAVKDGETFKPEVFAEVTVEIKDNRMTTNDPSEKRPFVMILKIDADKHPVQFETKPETKGQRSEDSSPGILELDGDTLKFAAAMEDEKTRPAKFEGGKGVFYLKLKRSK